MKSCKGKCKPMNPKKYRGDPTQVIYRSLWERKLMVYCDKNTSVIEWGSEEIIIPYRSPKDGRIHRYFPDFYMKVKQKNGTTKKPLRRHRRTRGPQIFFYSSLARFRNPPRSNFESERNQHHTK